ncbi:potassium channel family protein [Caldicellulosiruptor morganii]|uniref:NAD-binding protein n=1 Tax=Caldicellulosiruptor morganii TaxID=1387555 RepID=A0ABY7BPY3_9FIRM|nr:NAD-binding protein [Caldicellulosiruptor morganii]WAM33962.1 NAD-binding protein [Caldicellulosiruptor morganii]
MYIIVVGCGKVGSNLAKSLADEGHDVVVIDSDAKNFERLGPDFNGMKIQGVVIDEDVLKQAGIERADALAAVTPDDSTNIMIAQIAEEIYQVPKVIARIYDPLREDIFHSLGLETICPTTLAVEYIKSILLSREIRHKHRFGKDNVFFKYITPKRDDIGKGLDKIVLSDNCYLFGIIRNQHFYFKSKHIKLQENDIMVVAEKKVNA